MQKFAKKGGNEEVVAHTAAGLIEFTKEVDRRKGQILMEIESRLMGGERSKLNEKWVALPGLEVSPTPGDPNHICCKLQVHFPFFMSDHTSKISFSPQPHLGVPVGATIAGFIKSSSGGDGPLEPSAAASAAPTTSVADGKARIGDVIMAATCGVGPRGQPVSAIDDMKAHADMAKTAFHFQNGHQQGYQRVMMGLITHYNMCMQQSANAGQS